MKSIVIRVSLLLTLVCVIVAGAVYTHHQWLAPSAPEPIHTKLVEIGPTPLDKQIQWAIDHATVVPQGAKQ